MTETLNREVGRLEGQLAALTQRVDRHEQSISQQLEGINEKLDQISTAIATGAGSSKGSATLLHWALSAAAVAAAWWHGEVPHIGAH